MLAQTCALVFLCVSVPDEVQESHNNDRSSHQAYERAEGQKQIHSWNRKEINIKFNVAKNNLSDLPAIFDPFHFAYYLNHSTFILHQVITHLDYKDAYAITLYINFSSAFNYIIPQRLTEKLPLIGLDNATSLDFGLSDSEITVCSF